MKQTSLILAKECMSLLISIAFLICFIVMTVGIWLIRDDIHSLNLDNLLDISSLIN
jgi:hypothetical protein